MVEENRQECVILFLVFAPVLHKGSGGERETEGEAALMFNLQKLGKPMKKTWMVEGNGHECLLFLVFLHNRGLEEKENNTGAALFYLLN